MDASVEDLFRRLERLNDIGASLSKERHLPRLLEKILLAAKSITGADGGTLYRMSEDKRHLHFEIVRNDTLKIAFGGTSGQPISDKFQDLPLYKEDGAPNNSMVAAYAGNDHVKVEDVEKIVSEHLYKGRVVKELELSDIDLETNEKILDIDKIKFYEKQKRIALRNCGKINPEDIQEYIAVNGYEALGKVLTTMKPQEVIDEMKKSGSPDVKRLLGYDAPDGTTLGAVKDWGYQIVKQVGNYAEVFDRNVGKDSPLKIDRAENNLWNKGGFLYAPPVR